MTLAHFAGMIARSLGLASQLESYKAHRDRYRAPTRPKAVLPAEYFEPVERVRGSRTEAPTHSGIYDRWAGLAGGHKWLHYFEIYDALFSVVRSRPIRMLEIGVYKGGSLRMWRQVLHPESVLVGIDIDPGCARFDRPGERTHVRIGDQTDPVFLTSVASEFGPFDVILDDGSHICSHMIASFGHLFLSALAEDGLYIVEDTHTNFWPQYRDRAYSFIDLAKDLVDLMHGHYPMQTGEPAYRVGHAEQRASLNVPRVSAQIREISFHDSIIAIRKKPVGPLPASQHN
jgi:methyltransferase family protein